MIIDDDSDDRYFFKSALAEIDNSIRCIQAGGGEESLELLHKAEVLPEIIFLDVNMPCVNGHDTLKALKKNQCLRNIPVVMYSTSFSEDSIYEFYRCGAHACLIKPINISELPRQIMAIVESVDAKMHH